MAEDVKTYLRELQAELLSSRADPALIQDALFDAEEHLQAEMAAGGEGEAGNGAISEQERAARFATAVEGYGAPEEVAAAYLGVSLARDTAESTGTVAVRAQAETTATEPLSDASIGRPMPAQTAEKAQARCAACGVQTTADQVFCGSCGTQLRAVPPPAQGYQPVELVPTGVQYGMQAAGATGTQEQSAWKLIFGPFADGRVWTSLVYMILSLATGIVYFTIVVTGLSTAGGMLVLIIGVPLFMLVLAIVRGLALLEGRLVEALLGTRMPRRSRPVPPNFGFWQRMLFWLKDGRTWASMAYMLLMLPMGIVYFTVAVTGLAVGLSLVTTPVWAWIPWVVDNRMVEINGVSYNWPLWAIPIAFVAGALLLIGFMHLVKWIGRGHAAFAKAMLVRLN